MTYGLLGCREYLVSPILLSTLPLPQYARRKIELQDIKGKRAEHYSPMSWVDMRMHKLLDSGLSGALTGGMLNAWKRAHFYDLHMSVLTTLT